MYPHSPACCGAACSLSDANVPDFICAKIFAGDVFELELLFDGAGDGVDTMLLNGDCPKGEKPVGSATLLIIKKEYANYTHWWSVLAPLPRWRKEMSV